MQSGEIFKSNGDGEIIDKEAKIASGELQSYERIPKQISLACDAYEEKTGHAVDMTHFRNSLELRNEIMSHWTGDGDNSLAKAYYLIENSQWIKDHPDLMGDISKVELRHIKQFMAESAQAFSN